MTAAQAASRSSFGWLTIWWRRRWLRRSTVIAASLVAIYFTADLWLPAAGRWLDVGQPPRPSDYCLVLSGDDESRPFVAAALYKKGFVGNQIWLTHPAMPDSVGEDRNQPNRRALRILTVLGVPADRISELPGDCVSTFDEAIVLARAMTGHANATVNVVTSNFHTRRARWIIRRELGSAADRIRFVSVPTDYYDAACWWKVEEGFTTYTKEFSKTIFYWLRYGWGAVWLAAALLVALSCRLKLRPLRLRPPPRVP